VRRRSSTPADRGQSQKQQEKRVADSKGRRRRHEKEEVHTIITLDSHFTSNDNKIAES
jgi:hypothetical protein